MSRPTFPNREETVNADWTFKKNLAVNGTLTGGNVGYKGQGKEFYVDAVSGSDGYDGLTAKTAKASLAAAYALTTSGKNDTIYLLSSTSMMNLAATLTWSKSETHLVGVGSPSRMAQRARIGHSANFSPLITVSGDGCLFSNLYISHGRGSATNLIAVTITGGRNAFENVHFAGPQHATEAAEATYMTVNISGADAAENTFVGCVLGNNTIARSAANCAVNFTGGAPRTFFEDCYFVMMSSAATPVHVAIAATGIDRFAIFKNCFFHSHGTTLTQAIDSNISDTTNRQVFILGDSVSVGATDIADATGDGTIWFKPDTATANVALLGVNVAVA